jgi:peptidoglycan-associated lipoprotein
MFNLRTSKVAFRIAWGVFALLMALSAGARAQEQDDGGANGETAAELLIDGTDAANDRATDSARRLFHKLIAAFPDSPEASRARRALAGLDLGGNRAADLSAMRADETERTVQYRRAFLIDIGDRVFFAENSATIGARARGMIENQARWLKARPGLTVTIIGRSDDGGDGNASAELSRQRAEVVRARLLAAGLDAARIELKAAGDEDRLAVCPTPMCQAQNRNAEVLINDGANGSGGQPGQQMPAAAKASLGTSAQSGTAYQVP